MTASTARMAETSGSMPVNRELCECSRADSVGWCPNMKLLMSYEFLLSLFVFSGLYKGYPIMTGLPVDLTVVLGVCSVVTALLMLASRRVRLTRHRVALAVMGLLFFAWMTLSALWSTDLQVAMHKGTVMLPTVVITFLGCVLIVCSSEQRCERFINSIVLLAVVQTVVVVIAYLDQRSIDGLILASGDYLGSGFLIGIAWTSVYSRIVFGKLPPRGRIVGTALLLLWGTANMLLGGKQNLLGMVLVAGWSIMIQGRAGGSAYRAGRALALIVILSSFVLFGQHMAVGRGQSLPTVYRLLDAITGFRSSSSSQTRISLMTQAWEGWLSRPVFGHGLGSFGPDTCGGGTNVYPHNIILEVLYEAGLVGFIGLGALVGVSVHTLRHNWLGNGHTLGPSLALMFAFAMLTMMVSNTYADARGFFAVLGLLSVSRDEPWHAGLGAPSSVEVRTDEWPFRA